MVSQYFSLSPIPCHFFMSVCLWLCTNILFFFLSYIPPHLLPSQTFSLLLPPPFVCLAPTCPHLSKRIRNIDKLLSPRRHFNIWPAKGKFKDFCFHGIMDFPRDYPVKPPTIEMTVKIPHESIFHFQKRFFLKLPSLGGMFVLCSKRAFSMTAPWEEGKRCGSQVSIFRNSCSK